MAEKTIRWGVCGTGTIANDFVKCLQLLPGTEVAAVGSRTAASAAAFGDKFDIPTRHASYEALAADDTIDVVYVATPSLLHVEHCLLFLGAGRAVLCEKAMAPDLESAEQVLSLAHEKGLFFLHGVWSRFFPAMRALRDVIDGGMIGTVVAAHASFGQNDGAGCCSATLETGIYCAQFLHWALRGTSAAAAAAAALSPAAGPPPGGLLPPPPPPPEVCGVAVDVHEASGLDQHATALVRFPPRPSGQEGSAGGGGGGGGPEGGGGGGGGGGMGTLECSLRHPSPRAATICGTEGVITVAFPFWCPTKFTVQRMTGRGSQTMGAEEVHEFPLPPIPEGASFNFVNSQGLLYEAAEVNRCLRAGLTESPTFDSQSCREVMAIITDIRARFPTTPPPQTPAPAGS